MNQRYFPYECPDFRLRRHHTDELMAIAIFASDTSLKLGGNINGLYDPIAMAKYLGNGTGSA